MGSAEGCSACDEPLRGQQGIHALGRIWHKACFVCDFCRSADLSEQPFIERYSLGYCAPCDLRLFGNYCKGCNGAISGASVSALNALWHAEHFACRKCNRSLTDGQFSAREGMPYCVNCASTL